MGRIDADTESAKEDELTEASFGGPETPEQASLDGSESAEAEVVRVGEDVQDYHLAGNLGTERYVIAGFFSAIIVIGYLFGKITVSTWNALADAQWAIDRAPWLARMSEDARETWSMAVGGVVGLIAVIYMYKRDDIRTWVQQAADELAKVTWPDKKEVTTGTVVVIVASLIAAIYLALLDRFWGFVTDLVYRA